MSLRVELALDRGRVVRRRLADGAPGRVHAPDAEALAGELAGDGAPAFALVDLDVEAGGDRQLELVRRIAAHGLPVSYRGGVSTARDVEALVAAGVGQVVLDGAAFGDPAFLRYGLDVLGERLAVALDGEGASVRVPLASGPLSLVDAAAEFAYRGVRAFVYTDAGRAGALAGPNLGSLGRLCDAVEARITYGGGVATLDDVRSVALLRRPNLAELQIASALWERRFTLPEALEAAGEKTGGTP